MSSALEQEGKTSSLETAVLGGGCFWCLEAIFNELQGVVEVRSGYAGGHVPFPTYQQVCTGKTGHAEVIWIRFGPQVITYRQILQIFFSFHDPTTLNRQGNDVGTQYRSVIFYRDLKQKEIAQEVLHQIDKEGIWDKPIVTELSQLELFYPAEDYHQEYYKYNSQQPYCQAVIAPKLSKFRQQFLTSLKKN